MCISSRPSVMSNTRIYVGEAKGIGGKTLHVLAYQNAAKTDGPNAMILPFPTDVAMSEENVIDTRPFKNFLKDIVEATRERHDFSRGMLTLGAVSAKGMAKVFDVGSYTVVLAKHVDQIPKALSRVPSHKRPEISKDFLEGFKRLYPDQPVAVCCWDGEIEAEPLMWWYEPHNTDTLFIPTMDAHDGEAPKKGDLVKTDHIICVSSLDADRGEEVHYSQLDQMDTTVRKLLPRRVHGHKLPSRMENDDCFVKTAALRPNKDSLWMDSQSNDVRLTRGREYTYVMRGWR